MINKSLHVLLPLVIGRRLSVPLQAGRSGRRVLDISVGNSGREATRLRPQSPLDLPVNRAFMHVERHAQ